MITITREELKSAANDQLSSTAQQVAKEINAQYRDTWRAPLKLIGNAIDNENLGIAELLSLMKSGMSNVVDIVALQISVDDPLLESLIVTQQEFADRLVVANINPDSTLKLSSEQIASYKSDDITIGDLIYIPNSDSWLMTIILPLNRELIPGKSTTLSARINLERLKESIAGNQFNSIGSIVIVDSDGKKIFNGERPDLTDLELVKAAVDRLQTNSRAVGVQPYTKPSGDKMLGAYAFPQFFNWGIIVEQKESDAYLAIAIMTRSLTIWVLIGLAGAIVGAFIFAMRISRPIIQIGEVAQKVGLGDFEVRVPMQKSRDEIGQLGRQMNDMIKGLRERFHLEKFVSGSTIDAIKQSDKSGVSLGGERKNVTVFFSDIRGFTAFSEKHEPEVVIDMLNTYLRRQAQIVRKHGGDIDKYVGDELVAVFQDDDMAANAILCALEIQFEMTNLNTEFPQWNIGIGIGINSGEVIVGAMGSEERMDYTMIGDTVNLGARLCSAAGPLEIIISNNSYQLIKDITWQNKGIEFGKLEPIQVKGKVEPIQIYNVVQDRKS